MDPLIDDLVDLAQHRPPPAKPVIVGITGAPGAGKSTLAERMVAGLTARGRRAVLVPMDGFHLADVSLQRLGLLERKGAPETFDPWGYVALLERVRAALPHTVYAPAFERDLEQPLAGAIAVEPGVEFVITEGNYLLLDQGPWAAVRDLLDVVWFVEVDAHLRRERLVERHVRFGKTRPAAEAWVRDVDEPNAVLVTASRPKADRVVSGG